MLTAKFDHLSETRNVNKAAKGSNPMQQRASEVNLRKVDLLQELSDITAFDSKSISPIPPVIKERSVSQLTESDPAGAEESDTSSASLELPEAEGEFVDVEPDLASVEQADDFCVVLTTQTSEIK